MPSQAPQSPAGSYMYLRTNNPESVAFYLVSTDATRPSNVEPPPVVTKVYTDEKSWGVSCGRMNIAQFMKELGVEELRVKEVRELWAQIDQYGIAVVKCGYRQGVTDMLTKTTIPHLPKKDPNSVTGVNRATEWNKACGIWKNEVLAKIRAGPPNGWCDSFHAPTVRLGDGLKELGNNLEAKSGHSRGRK